MLLLCCLYKHEQHYITQQVSNNYLQMKSIKHFTEKESIYAVSFSYLFPVFLSFIVQEIYKVLWYFWKISNQFGAGCINEYVFVCSYHIFSQYFESHICCFARIFLVLLLWFGFLRNLCMPILWLLALSFSFVRI